VDIVGFITSQNLFDLLYVLFLFAAFVLGFIQGAIRRLLGIASILFSYLLAANVRDVLGNFLASNWTQFPAEYSYMLGFLGVFVVSSIVLTLIIQGVYKRTALLANTPIVDEILGAVLGVVQAVLIVGCVIAILDSFFLVPGIPSDPNELPFLRDFFAAYDHAAVAELYRATLLPAFYVLFGWIVPNELEQLHARVGGVSTR